jgi:Photosynthetic reaction centre cytochrome C subunit
MKKETASRGLICTLFGTVLIFSIIESITLPAFTQQKEKRTAEQVYKNIQALKGIPASQLKPTMAFIAGSLGVSCEHCHSNPWESDLKPAKQIARQHIQMTQSINNKSFGGRMVITCNSCHQGQLVPPSIPSLAQAAWLKSENQVEAGPSSDALPTVEQVFGKYFQAVGGKLALEKLKTIVLKGSLTSYNAMNKPVPLAFEIYEAPNRRLVAINTPNGTSYQGFDGTIGWISNPLETREMRPEELAQFKQGAELSQVVKLKDF